MIYGSVCSGIEAASVAWEPLGWKPAFFSEIEPFPRAVLAHHYPEVPCHGDFTTIREREYAAIDLLVGGTPCQSFSVAGLRGGLDDDRGNLALEFCRLARRLGPRWVAWENVPGVLSLDGGRAFGAILGGLAECGYGLAYRVLDAQYVRVDGYPRAVPQRRRRVFVVGYFGDWRRAAAVLFEPESLRGDPPPRRTAGASVAALTANGAGTCGADDNQAQAGHLTPQAFGGNNTSGPIDVSTACNAHGGRIDFETETFVAHALRADGFDASEDGTWRSAATEMQGVRRHGARQGVVWETLHAGEEGRNTASDRVGIGHGKGGAGGWAVRRLTPRLRECERLQGFPDDYTAIPYRGKTAADGPRYRAIGNSMACNVMAWIGRRIEIVENL